MLQTPDKFTDRILRLADLIENLEPALYNQSLWSSCICGYALQQGTKEGKVFTMNPADYEAAANYLGISLADTSRLFIGTPASFADMKHWHGPVTTKDAAKVLRHLAIVGEVDWKVCLPRKEQTDESSSTLSTTAEDQGPESEGEPEGRSRASEIYYSRHSNTRTDRGHFRELNRAIESLRSSLQDRYSHAQNSNPTEQEFSPRERALEETDS